MNEVLLAFTRHEADRTDGLVFPVRRLYLGGWAGRSRQDVQQHINELAKLGVQAPTDVPIVMPMPPHLVTTSGPIEVRDHATSGEVEYVLLFDGERLWVTVGSDHTDREIERVDIAKSKQLYPNVIAPALWPYDEVRDHWDALELTCWVETEGQFRVYQHAPLSALYSATSWVDRLQGNNLLEQGTVLFSGSLPTLSGTLINGDAYRFRLSDPIRNRILEHSYRVVPLPGFGA